MTLNFRGGIERERERERERGITLPDFFNFSHLKSMRKALFEVLFRFVKIINLTTKKYV
jgi:hypothetical protein